MNAQVSVFPRQPVLERGALGRRQPSLPSLLTLPNRALTRSGRSALVMALQLLGTRAGEGVLVPTYHCPTMIAPVERLGAKPVYYPLNTRGMPDLGFLSALDTSGVRAMLVAHLFGIPQSLQAVVGFCRERGISLIEDCAHCWYGETDDGAVGRAGDFAIGSLTKFFPVLEGGLLGSATRRIELPSAVPGALKKEARALWDMIDMSARADRLGLVGGAVRAMARGRRLLRPRAAAAASEPVVQSGAELYAESMRDPLLEPVRLTSVESWVVEHSDPQTAIEGRRRTYEGIAAGLAGLPRSRLLWPECGSRWAPYVVPLLVDDADAPYQRMRQMTLPVFRWDRIWPGTPRIPGDAALEWGRGLIQIACHQSLQRRIPELLAGLRQCLTSPAR